MVTKKRLIKAEDNFRNIRFPGTEFRLGKAPDRFLSKKVRGEKGFKKIEFPGTRGRLGTPPREADQRKKARNRLQVFNIGDELI